MGHISILLENRLCKHSGFHALTAQLYESLAVLELVSQEYNVLYSCHKMLFSMPLPVMSDHLSAPWKRAPAPVTQHGGGGAGVR